MKNLDEILIWIKSTPNAHGVDKYIIIMIMKQAITPRHYRAHTVHVPWLYVIDIHIRGQ